MNWREATLKVALTVIPTAILIMFGVHFILAFIIAHTLNFAFNGQLYAMYTHGSDKRHSPTLFGNNGAVRTNMRN